MSTSHNDHEHYHTDSDGVLVKCYHQCKTVLLMPSFWIGATLSFPLEHLIWEKLWPFNILTHFLGL